MVPTTVCLVHYDHVAGTVSGEAANYNDPDVHIMYTHKREYVDVAFQNVRATIQDRA